MAGNTTKELSLKTKLIVIGIIALIILIVGILIFRAGRKKGSVNVSAPIIDNPADPSKNTTPATSTSDIQKLAQLVHKDMDGSNLYHDTDLWVSRVLTLSDTDLARLYSEFNLAYEKESGETFTEWIGNEMHWVAVPFLTTEWETIQKTLLTRLTGLNLK